MTTTPNPGVERTTIWADDSATILRQASRYYPLQNLVIAAMEAGADALDEVKKYAILRELVEGGLTTDGGHHKQWYLERIAIQFELDIPDHEPGIPP